MIIPREHKQAYNANKRILRHMIKTQILPYQATIDKTHRNVHTE